MGWTILITNNTLHHRAGSELYVRDIALGLRERGHFPIAYSTELGDVAAELRRATIPVVDNLESLAIVPDVIHGHHHLETVTASLRFPRTPVLSFCHGWLPWEEIPTTLPTVARYVAVDATCRDRLLHEHGIAPERISLLLNFVDLRRFRPRGPLPERPGRALVFGNTAGEPTCLAPIREACARRGISVDVAGMSARVLDRPEEVLGEYDLVFAKARAAMEAMAVGCAVVLCDRVGAGPLVTSERFTQLREINFGIRALQLPLTAEGLGAQIDRYDAGEAARVRELMRDQGDLERRLDELLALYASVLEEPRVPADPAHLARSAAAYLRWLAPRVKGFEAAREQARLLREDLGAETRAREEAERRLGRAAQELAVLRLAPGLRLQAALRRIPLIGTLARAVSRRIIG